MISIRESLASESAISCEVAPFPTLICRSTRGFAGRIYLLGIKREWCNRVCELCCKEARGRGCDRGSVEWLADWGSWRAYYGWLVHLHVHKLFPCTFCGRAGFCLWYFVDLNFHMCVITVVSSICNTFWIVLWLLVSKLTNQFVLNSPLLMLCDDCTIFMDCCPVSSQTASERMWSVTIVFWT